MPLIELETQIADAPTAEDNSEALQAKDDEIKDLKAKVEEAKGERVTAVAEKDAEISKLKGDLEAAEKALPAKVDAEAKEQLIELAAEAGLVISDASESEDEGGSSIPENVKGYDRIAASVKIKGE